MGPYIILISGAVFAAFAVYSGYIENVVFPLENGQIVEQGSHDELLAQNGKYAQMWKVQAGAYIAV